jgi:hypothetical protein
MTKAEVYGEIIRDGLLSVLDTRAADELLTCAHTWPRTWRLRLVRLGCAPAAQ